MGPGQVQTRNTWICRYIEDIQIFAMNMPFISSSEAKNAYFMSGEATNEIYIFLLHEMAYSFQKFEFSFYYIQFKAWRMFCTKWRHTRLHIMSY